MTSLTMAAILQTAVLAAGPQDAAQDAATQAYNRSMQTGRPLVFLLGAKWCPACNVMKDKTLPRVAERGGMRGVEFAYVDIDKQPELAQRLLRGRSIPQLVRYDRTEKGWQPQHMIGAQSPEKVTQFLATRPARPATPERPATRYSSYQESQPARQPSRSR